MKTQVLLIHGGDTFNTHEEYLEFLKNIPLDIESLKPHVSWKRDLQDKLGQDFEVLYPQMPNSSNAQYSEWKLWLEKVLPLLNEELIIIGHSLGAVFIAKYLAENKINKKIKALVLLAGPAKDIEGEPLASFTLPESLSQVEQQAEKIYLLHSEDDPVVPFEHLGIYQQKLPSAKSIVFKDRQHFNQEEFSELVELIKQL